jgi:hypothetical protein
VDQEPGAAGQHDDVHVGSGTSSGACLSLLFRKGERPEAEAIARTVETAREGGLVASVSYRPDPAAGWLELLASGLTFDLAGLSPLGPAPAVEVYQAFGFDRPCAVAELEAVQLVPSGHILSGAGLLPVMRTMMGLAANLVLHLPVAAVHWGAAQTLMEPRYFSRLMLNWLAGGAFPSLGLTAFSRAPDGSIGTRGLAHFTGQEMQLEASLHESDSDTARLAVRVIDHLVRHGGIAQAQTIGQGSDALLLEPSKVGKLVLVWRGG